MPEMTQTCTRLIDITVFIKKSVRGAGAVDAAADDQQVVKGTHPFKVKGCVPFIYSAASSLRASEAT